MKLTRNHINYFMDSYRVDVSNIRIIDTNLDNNRGGLYKPRTLDCIYIDTQHIKSVNPDSSISTLLTTTTIVHEVTHYMQYVHGIFSFIDTDETYADLCIAQQDMNYTDRAVEFDAIMSELKYLYYCNREKIVRVLPIIKDYAVRVLATATVQSIREYCMDINEADEWCRDVLQHVINTRKIKNIKN